MPSHSSGVVADRRSADELRAVGCNCEFGCRRCGMAKAMMGACPAWNACPMGRAAASDCPVHGTEE
jgi:hypothetical protein